MTKRTAKKERAERTRVDILQAGIDVFARRGIVATTMNDLAKAIDMTPGALYWHFKSKEDLLLAAMEELHRRFIGEFTEVLTEGRKWTARKQLRTIFERQKAFFRYHPTHGIFFAMLSVEAPHNNVRVADALRETLKLYVAAVEGIVRYGQKKGEFRDDTNPNAFAQAWLSTHLGMIVHQQLFVGGTSYDQLCDSIDTPMLEGFERDIKATAA